MPEDKIHATDTFPEKAITGIAPDETTPAASLPSPIEAPIQALTSQPPTASVPPPQPPRLLSVVDERFWPSIPDDIAGAFRLELSIGTNGRITDIKPLCDGDTCIAARAYAEVVRTWTFTPAEAEGHPVPGRLLLDFDVAPGNNDRDRDTDHTPRQ